MRTTKKSKRLSFPPTLPPLASLPNLELFMLDNAVPRSMEVGKLVLAGNQIEIKLRHRAAARRAVSE